MLTNDHEMVGFLFFTRKSDMKPKLQKNYNVYTINKHTPKAIGLAFNINKLTLYIPL